jgi:hypothetical protein
MVNAFSSPGIIKNAVLAISDSSFVAHIDFISCDVIVLPNCNEGEIALG